VAKLDNIKWKKRAQLVEREIEQEAVLLDLKSGVYYSLNEVGTEIWRLLGAGATESELAAAVAAQYDVNPDTAARDIGDLLKDMAAEGLIIKEPA
jgi:hypothetical protein